MLNSFGEADGIIERRYTPLSVDSCYVIDFKRDAYTGKFTLLLMGLSKFKKAWI